MKALLIIDMQLGSFKPYEVRNDTLGTIANINKLSEHFRKNNDKVIFIQHDGTKENVFIPHSADWQLLPELTQGPSDVYISKTANDAFYNTELHAYLMQHNIQELIITGCATDFCIDSTIKSAITKNYLVSVATDAHTTADRPNLSATQVIQHYNWLWADMTPIIKKISVLKTAELLK